MAQNLQSIVRSTLKRNISQALRQNPFLKEHEGHLKKLRNPTLVVQQLMLEQDRKEVVAQRIRMARRERQLEIV